jgi:hypothetical protein
LESEAGHRHRATLKRVNVYAIIDFALLKITRCASVNLDVLRGFEPDISQSYHNHYY